MIESIQWLAQADPADLLRLTNWIMLGGLLLNVAEHAYCHENFRDNEVYDWGVLKYSERLFLSPGWEGLFDVVFGYHAYLVNLALQLAFILASGWSLWQGLSTVWFTAGLLVLVLVSHYRNSYGHDGADQMTNIILAGLFFAGLAPESELVQQASLAFIGGQSILSYVTAGVYKAVAPDWRSGSSLTLVMSTRSYGRPDLSALLDRNPPISRSLSILLIIFECSFFLVLFAGPYGSAFFSIGGVVFHFLNACVMGLNNFLWAFAASYPGVLFCAITVSGWLYGE